MIQLKIKVSTLFVILFLTSCSEQKVPYYNFTGPTMGTTYSITLQTNDPIKIKGEIDSILLAFNASLSTYIDSSTISMFNKCDSQYCYTHTVDPYFLPVFIHAQELYTRTQKAFNPAIAPLVNYYGFGYKEKKKLSDIDTVKVNELLTLVNFETIHINTYGQDSVCITKKHKKQALDFNALAPGYAVDLMAQHFSSHGILNFMINLSGEISTRGVNADGTDWIIGINKPMEGANPSDIELPLTLTNISMATSGNYRNSYESKGQKFAHIINPYTGISQPTDILSTTVITDLCVDADALATAFMVMGLKKSLQFAEQMPNVEACFIYDIEGDGTFEFNTTAGFHKYMMHNEQR